LGETNKGRMTRRAFLGLAAGAGATMLLFRNGGDPACAAPAAPDTTTQTPVKHNMWVWRFDVDGDPRGVLENCQRAGLGVVLKTNDGADWMSRYDDSPTAITGPQKVREMADFFEGAGVPFHAWCVPHGLDPIGEAQICSEVLNSGARSMIFDLEPSDGTNYWQADGQAALVLGQEMRRLQPNAQLGVAPDARPWQIDAVPTAEFASFVNDIQPQSYWRTFDGPTNRRRISELGHFVGPVMTPEVILDATVAKLAPFGLPIRPLGQGAANGHEWDRFVRHAYNLQIDSVGVWRYGTTDHEVWPTLQMLPPPQPAAGPERAAPPVAQAGEVPTAETAIADSYVPTGDRIGEPPDIIRSSELSYYADMGSLQDVESRVVPDWVKPLLEQCK
jgi:hypothetical protein